MTLQDPALARLFLEQARRDLSGAFQAFTNHTSCPDPVSDAVNEATRLITGALRDLRHEPGATEDVKAPGPSDGQRVPDDLYTRGLLHADLEVAIDCAHQQGRVGASHTCDGRGPWRRHVSYVHGPPDDDLVRLALWE